MPRVTSQPASYSVTHRPWLSCTSEGHLSHLVSLSRKVQPPYLSWPCAAGTAAQGLPSKVASSTPKNAKCMPGTVTVPHPELMWGLFNCLHYFFSFLLALCSQLTPNHQHIHRVQVFANISAPGANSKPLINSTACFVGTCSKPQAKLASPPFF